MIKIKLKYRIIFFNSSYNFVMQSMQKINLFYLNQ